VKISFQSNAATSFTCENMTAMMYSGAMVVRELEMCQGVQGCAGCGRDV
jgi:hypothetical protein